MSNLTVRVLLIEDDEDDYILIRTLLSEIHNAKFELAWVSTFDTALNEIDSCGHDVYLLDYRLGMHNGLEILHEAKRRKCEAPIIFLTGQEDYNVDLEAMKAGAVDYLVKDQIDAHLLERSIRYAMERKRAEEALRASEESLRSVLQSMDDFVFMIDKDGTFRRYFQPAHKNDLYVPAEEFLGKHYSKVLPPDVAEALEKAIQNIETSGKTQQLDYSLPIRGQRLVFEARVTPIKDLSNGHVGYTVVARNITERKRMEKALIQKEKLKTLGEISAEVAHEIRNPLVSIGGFARRLREKFPDLQEVKIILRESERLERILDGIRDYLKPVEVRATKCSVNDIIRECVDLLSPQLKRRALTYQLNLDPHLPMGLVDPDILRQICINLIRNAADSAEAGGTLVIETAEGNTYLNILFKNPVRSLQIKDPKLLFLPFGEGGQSIGLPLCYRLLKDMGGLISFSEEGGFVVFTISLPKLPWSGSKEDHSRIAR